MGEFVRVNFDKLLLSGLVILFVAVIVYCLHRPILDTAGTVSFCEDMAKLFAGALLTLITGRVLAKTNGNGGSGHDVPSKTGQLPS